MRRTFAAARFGAFAAIAFAGLGGIGVITGTLPAANAAPTKPASAASKAFESGSAAYKKGSYKTATQQLSVALRSGGLSSREMAHAMYMRGLAYKKMNKPGLAISDLTSAVWLKNGLNEAEKKNALAARSEAYRMAGLADGEQEAAVVIADPKATSAPAPAPAQPPQIQTPSAAASSTAAATQQAPAPNPTPAPVATPSTSSYKSAATQRVEDHALTSAVAGQLESRSADASPPPASSNSSESSLPWLTDSTSNEPVQQQPAATPPTTETTEEVALNTPTQTNTPAPASTPVPAVQPQAAAAPASPTTLNTAPANNGISAMPGGAQTANSSAGTADSSTVTSQVSGFFSNIFGGGGGSTTPTPSSQPQQQTAAAAPDANGTQVSSFTTSAIPEPPQPASPPSVTAPASYTPGKYKLHIAALRSKTEAEQLAANLTAKHGGDFENRRPVIDKAAIGSMGTFYRVRLGGYKSAAIPQKICEKLRGGGFDCLVVTN